MSRRVAIIGVGMEKSGSAAVPSWKLFANAALRAIGDAGIETSRIEALHLGNVYSAFTEKQTNMAPLALFTMGMNTSIPATRYETACASGSVAFRQGYLGILSGMYDIVLVGGAERLKAISGTAVQEAMATSMDAAERSAGLTFAVYWSYVAKAYARKHNLDHEQLQNFLAKISVKNHFHGSFNKKAQFQKEVAVEDILNSPVVAPPIKVMDCCPFSDGAAAPVLASESVAKRSSRPVWIAGSGQASGSWSIADSPDLATNPAITKAAQVREFFNWNPIFTRKCSFVVCDPRHSFYNGDVHRWRCNYRAHYACILAGH